MRTITREYKIYKYEELTEEAKEKVKEWYLESKNAEDFEYTLKCDLEAQGLNNLKSYYRLSYCQGDGLCLYGSIEFEEIEKSTECLPEGTIKDLFYKGFNISDYKAISILKKYSKINFIHSDSHYCHKYTVDIDIEIEEESEKMYNFLEKTVNKLKNNIKEWYYKICDEYEQWGYDYFYKVEDEELKEYCDINNIEFYEDGSIL